MPLHQTLFRIHTPLHDAADPQFTRWQAGLVRHLQHADLPSIFVQIGREQRAYLALPTCIGCSTGRCVMGCYVALFQRLLRACFGAEAWLAPVQRGLSQRPYTRYAIAWPTAIAQPLTAEQITLWPEARLVVNWQQGAAPHRVGALLATNAEGPALAPYFAARGWQSLPIRHTSLIRSLHQWLPLRTPLTRVYRNLPWTLLAVPAEVCANE